MLFTLLTTLSEEGILLLEEHTKTVEVRVCFRETLVSRVNGKFKILIINKKIHIDLAN